MNLVRVQQNRSNLVLLLCACCGSWKRDENMFADLDSKPYQLGSYFCEDCLDNVGLLPGELAPENNLSADRKSTRLNSNHTDISRMPSSA